MTPSPAPLQPSAHDARAPTIAAVVPLYNKAAHIERALRSLTDQSAPADEILIVNDASTDASAALTHAFFSHYADHPVRMFERSEPGPGGYAARNLAIEQASADWIAFLDADDAWEPHYLAQARALIASCAPDVGALFFSRTIVRANGAAHYESACDAEEATLDLEAFLGLWRRLKRCPAWTSATIIRRDVLIGAGLFPEGRCRRGGDKDTWLRAMERTRGVASRSVGATYHFDTTQQVTKLETTNTRHCMVETIEAMIARKDGRTRLLLRWLLNHEIWGYVGIAAGRGAILPIAYDAFNATSDPFKYAAIRLLAAAPPPLLRSLKQMRPGRR